MTTLYCQWQNSIEHNAIQQNAIVHIDAQQMKSWLLPDGIPKSANGHYSIQQNDIQQNDIQQNDIEQKAS
jgi:hypothetical protein